MQTISRLAALACAVATLARAGDGTVRDEPLDPRAAQFFAMAAPAEAKDDLAGLEDLPITWNPERVGCWVWDEPPEAFADCGTHGEARATVRANGALLRRFAELERLPVLRGDITRVGSVLLSMTKIAIVDMKIDLREGRADDAYRKWIALQRFARGLAASGGGWWQEMIGLLHESFSLGTLEALLAMDARPAERHAGEILALLEPATMQRYDLAGNLRSEYVRMMRQMEAWPDRDFLAPNHIANRYYRYAQDFIARAEDPGRIHDDPTVRDPQFWPSDRFVEQWTSQEMRELLGMMRRNNERMKALAVKVRAAAGKP